MTISIDVDIERITPVDSQDLILERLKVKMDGPGVIWIEGPNGAGKSILASVFAGKAFFEDSGLNVEGSVNLRTPEGKLVVAKKTNGGRHYAECVAFLPQKVGSAFLALHHQDDICFGIEGRFPELPGTTFIEKDTSAISRLNSIVNTLNLWAHLTKVLGQCSYGETRRVEFACTLSPHASLVVLDEPYSGLDQRWQQVVSKILTELPANYESIWVVTSHESPTKFNIKPDVIIKLKPKQYTLLPFQAIAQVVGQRFTTHPLDERETIEVRDLMVERRRYKGSRIELRDFCAKPGVVTWLVGDNGSGKSTVAQVLAGLLANSRIRKVTVAGNARGGIYDRGFPKAPSDKVRLALQDPFKSFVCRTVEEDLRNPDLLTGISTSPVSDIARHFWQELSQGWGRIDRRPYTFSFGQLRFLQLLLIPRSVEVVIIDEPLLGVHPSLHSTMISTLLSIAESGRIVIATCELDVIDSTKNVKYTMASQ